MRKIVALLSLFVLASAANAGKIYFALFPTNTQYHALVTIAEKPCTQAEGNALYASGKTAVMGCWKLEGQQIVVKWTTGEAPAEFKFEDFKLVNDDGDSVAAAASKRGTTTHLNCSAQGWIGDLIVDRDEAGVLKKLTVSGEDVSFSEKGTAINFSYQGKNISLSTTTGIFNFETSGFQSYLNNRLLGGGNVKGTGSCKLSDGAKRF
jgi:hypothetical protein